jgi:hypothetical protein
MLTVPFAQLVRRRHSPMGWTALAIAYALPFIGLALWGTTGNASLIMSVCILFALAALSLDPATEDSPRNA